MSGEHMQISWGPVSGPPTDWNKDALIAHVKTGMQIELGTLPLYFCALYSIKQDGGQWASSARMHIISVAEQEMLHLALAGNMLRSLDGVQTLYDRDFMPTYPSQILFDKVDMKLQPANKENLDCFLRIEAPYMPQPKLTSGGAAMFASFIPEYKSIGQFYKELETGIKQASQTDPNLFSHNGDMQFTGDEFFDSKMTVIRNEATALQALETIVDQGEGSIGVPDSHYAIFVELYQQRQNWQTVDYIDAPATDKYKDSEVAYRLSLAVNASYCYLLQTIDLCWKENNPARRPMLFRNLHRLMIEILSPCSHVLVTQQLDSGKYAAPCFEFYPPEQGAEPLPPKDLFDNLTKELEAAKRAAKDTATTEAITKILFCTKGLNPPTA
ncbi:ferritin-like-domain-containing protein [Mycena galopus ATCC 62051]|nr:ferritin-like-domain-containing protein [Mycena galopus ATCC 62051]